MNIVAVKFLRAFWEKYPDAEQPLKSWVDEAKKATWSQPSEIKEQYRSASILKNRRVVFTIVGATPGIETKDSGPTKDTLE